MHGSRSVGRLPWFPPRKAARWIRRRCRRFCSSHLAATLLVAGGVPNGGRSALQAGDASGGLKAPMLARLYQWMSLRPYLTTIYSPSTSTSMTARLLAGIARAEQQERHALPPTPPMPIRHRPRSPADILCALPGVGNANAARLLARFGTVASIAQASRDDLCETIGPKRGADLHDLLTRSA